MHFNSIDNKNDTCSVLTQTYELVLAPEAWEEV